MASVNKVILIGNCGRDAEVRTLPSGQPVANVSVATTMRRKDKSTGQFIDDTQWHRVTFYDRLAEIARDYVKKGKQVYVEGRLKYGKYTDQNGVERNTVDIIASELTLLGGRGDGDNFGGGGGSRAAQTGGSPQASYGGGTQNAGNNQGFSQTMSTAIPPMSANPMGATDMDDDIPF